MGWESEWRVERGWKDEREEMEKEELIRGKESKSQIELI